jgi:hypothetical protein
MGSSLQIQVFPPDPPIRQATVLGDIESGKLLGERFGNDLRVERLGVRAMPLGKAMPAATCRTEPLSVTRAMIPKPPDRDGRIRRR